MPFVAPLSSIGDIVQQPFKLQILGKQLFGDQLTRILYFALSDLLNSESLDGGQTLTEWGSCIKSPLLHKVPRLGQPQALREAVSARAAPIGIQSFRAPSVSYVSVS